MPTRQSKQDSSDDPIMPAVGAVILDNDGRVLLVKHVEAKRGGFWFGRWICPGGKLQPGETLEEGTRREIREETGLEIQLVGKPIVFERIVKEKGKTKLHVLYIDHIARVTGGRLKAGSDAAIAEWFSRAQLSERWNELHEDTRRLLLEARVVDSEVVNKIVA